jgi:hypothetical protein
VTRLVLNAMRDWSHETRPRQLATSFPCANENLQSELADLRSARGAALVMRRAAQAPATSGRHARILPRAIAIAVVLAIVISLLIVLRVL